LGKFIEKGLAGVRVVDTDELIESDTPNGDALKALEDPAVDPHGELYDAAWRKIFRAEIQRSIKLAAHTLSPPPRLLVFVGLLDHFGHKAPPVEIPEARLKFYMEVPTDLWLYRFYSRLSTIPSKDDYWRHAAGMTTHTQSVPGSKELLDDAVRTKCWHVDHGYEPLSAEQIVRKLSELLGLCDPMGKVQ